MMILDYMSRFGSPTLEAKKIKQQRIENGEEVFDAGLGESPFPLDPRYEDILKSNIKENKYSSVDGPKSLYRNVWGDNIIVGNGLKELIFCLIAGFSKLYPKSTLLVITPAWVSYSEHAEILNVKCEFIHVDKVTLRLSADVLDSRLDAIDGKVLLIFNSPCNPTGIVYTNNEVQQFASVIRKHDCIVFADDIYRDLIFDKESAGDIKKYLSDITVSGSSLSKSFGCGGWRYGWIGFPNNLSLLYQTTKNIAGSIYTAPSSIFHNAVAEMLDILDTEDMTNKICITCNKVVDFIKKRTNIQVTPAEGAWYLWFNFEKYADKLISIGIDTSQKLSTFMADKIGLITVAGSAFGSDQLAVRYAVVDIQIDNKSISIDHMMLGLKNLATFLDSI